jgi:Na+/serine symporter
MKTVTVDMLRAHLLVASLTAVGAEALVCIALLVLPLSQQFFGSASFRLFAIAVVVGGVIGAREFAQAAFEAAVDKHHAMPAGCAAWPVEFAVDADCPRRWLVVLHLRLTGKPFVLAAH